MNELTIYCFSGLGADERAFQRLDFNQNTVIHVPWIDALPNETLENYAKRISSVIDSSKPFVIMGLSFGGMLCVEMTKFLKPAGVILLSSITGRHEMPIRMKISGFLHLYRFIPNRYLNKPSKMAHHLFGVKTAEEKHLLDQILLESDSTFVHWALTAISKWKNTEVPNCYRIHGTADRIFPYKLQRVDATIEEGGHLMVISHATQVSNAMKEFFSIINVKNNLHVNDKQ